VTNVKCAEQITWTPLEPKPQQPFKNSPMERFGHAAEFSKVCSLGYSIEEGVLQGRIVLQTLLVRRATHIVPSPCIHAFSESRTADCARTRAYSTHEAHAHTHWLTGGSSP
jgi:hypothetical protein